jgi:hypothetical protein
MLNPRPKNALQAFVYKQYIVGILQGQNPYSEFSGTAMRIISKRPISKEIGDRP